MYVRGVCQVEPSHFPLARPDLLVFLPDCSYLIDLVISHPSAPSYLSLPPSPLSCARLAENRKITHYSSLLTSSSLRLVPFSLETFGAFGDRAKAFLSSLSDLARDPISTSLPSSPLAASLAVLLQKCNAYILSRGVVTSVSSSFRR